LAPYRGGRRMKTENPTLTAPVSKGRHEHQCRICSHPKRDEIEHTFIAWVSPAEVAKKFSISRDGLYRHAHVFGLMDKRRRNVRAALERIIEKAGEVEVTAAAVVAAVQAYSKINAIGQWVERSEHVNLNELFDRMTVAELDAYAKNGALPEWFQAVTGATATDGHEAADAK
jgi:hypothetical protein